MKKIKTIITNNIIFFVLEIAYFILLFFGAFDFLQNSATGTTFFFDLQFFIISQIIIVIISEVIAYIRYKDEISLKYLIRYYLSSFISILFVILFIFSTLPQIEIFAMIYTIIAYIFISWILAYMHNLLSLKPKKKANKKNAKKKK